MTGASPEAPGGPSVQGYRAIPGHFDEFERAPEAPAAVWRALLAEAARERGVPFGRTWERATHFLRQNGVTYNVYGDPRGLVRPWPVDALPLVLDRSEWSGIEAAVRQRVDLLERVLEDLHGPRRLLREGGLPPALLFGNPGYLPALNGVAPLGGHRLHLYAVDLARSADGHWWVVRDRAQAPSGAGYALENRLVSNRCFPDAQGRFQVERLAAFFKSFRDGLLAHAPGEDGPPRVALLTPGPLNETYFEHAYLARYLGFALVQGADLTVRRSRVYLKTLGGLQRVHVLLRRQDDVFCDPLELREDSLLGVPGLVESVRAGHVLVANGLGSGLVDAPALMPFLPGLAELLLGEELAMPSVATWWCGQPKARDFVRRNLDRLVIKPAVPSLPGEPVFPARLSADERATLMARIDERPHDWVAQEAVALSTVPTWMDGKLSSRHVILRVFAAAAPDGSHVVMPGGLTRVSGSPESIVVSMQEGGGSKDTWVLSDKPVPRFSMLDRLREPVALSRAGFVLSSRIADQLFWLGRYVERTEFTARIVRCLIEGMLDESEVGAGEEAGDLFQLLRAIGHRTPTPRRGAVSSPRWRLARDLAPVLQGDEGGVSMREDLIRLHQIAFQVRDRISVDAWRVISDLDERLRSRDGRAVTLADQLELLDQAIDRLAAFSGLVMDAMTREMGWRFLDTGRRIERSVALVRQLRYALARVVPTEERRLEEVLTISASVMTYRSRYASAIDPAAVLDLLLFDRTSPRSMIFQLVRISEHMLAVSDLDGRGTIGDGQSAVRDLIDRLEARGVHELATVDEERARPRLVELMDGLFVGFPELSERITRSYFAHAASTEGPHR